ncbi:glycoside hydrolase family 3 N-terminal domain-containing protein [Actinacidiphila yeochonensis]|uniref:glycoside hydrolase family 3 N-terminal domain-containing protein n=1 Tax=Actinacidiphila yeochonensis TaxID=89050 RepID=UPI00099C8D73|nr:glycoside hydrolase family 3 N-terminal domain-containing protein [Actinacidiphila yeochonensis]
MSPPKPEVRGHTVRKVPGPGPGPGPHAVRTPYSVRARRGALCLGLLVAVAACGGNGGSSSTTTPAAPSTSTPATTGSPRATSSPATSASTAAPSASTSGPATAQPAACVSTAFNAMDNAQRVGQLLMTPVGSTGLTSAQAAAIRSSRAGSVFLSGRTNAGSASVKAITDKVRGLATSVHGVKLGMFVSTDQEGGQVQVLRGPGFSTIPAATTQGTWSASLLQSRAAQWGRELQAAGVDMNLAPVADTVPPDLTSVNAPIGQLDREYGTTPSTVATHSTAFLKGMAQAKVTATAKHFPGLGRVRGNTDFSSGVTDPTTTRDDPFLLPFRNAVQAGVPFVMVSSAIYSRIDSHNQAAFSTTVIRGVLRGRLGFTGPVISDDLGQAVAVSDRSAGARAVDFIAAGGNVVLTVSTDTVAPMAAAVLSRMSSDAAFRADVDDSVKRVLRAKADAGLLTCG